MIGKICGVLAKIIFRHSCVDYGVIEITEALDVGCFSCARCGFKSWFKVTLE
jgi:hypothetical protein